MSEVEEDDPGTSSIYASLKDLSLDNATFFKSDTSSPGQRLFNAFSRISEIMDSVIICQREIMSDVALFDFDDNTPANGYRSFSKAMEKITHQTLKVARFISTNRNSYFFRKTTYSREIECCQNAIESLILLLNHCKTLKTWCDPGKLFSQEEHKAIDLIPQDSKFVNQYPFYGRCVGFQFCESLALIFKALIILMASFSEFYYSGGKVMDFLVNGSKYLIDPELRAKRIVNISQYASVDFCKAFWLLGEMELMQRIPSISNPALAVNKVISIETNPLSMESVKNGTTVSIPIPSSHKSPEPIKARLLSSSYYNGMTEIPKKEGMKEPSEGLIFHCHGGGFVAQSSKSHETYLRQWASSIPAPILSIDYSLAPECPYPRALEEIFYAYCWALQNVQILGSTAQRIVLAGDSAGANLSLGLAMKCIETGVRPPDGIFIAYAPVILKFIPSPSRLLCLMDPLLPFSFLMGCTKAYACPREVYLASKQHENKLTNNPVAAKRSLSLQNMPNGSQPFGINSTEDINEDNQTGTSRMDNQQISSDQTGNQSNVNQINNQTGTNQVGNQTEADSTPVLMGSRRPLSIYEYMTSLLSAVSNKFIFKSAPQSPTSPHEEQKRLEEEIKQEEFLPCPRNVLNFDTPHDPYMSPIYATDEILKQLPPVSILTVHFDPFLDDCVEFAKRLKHLNNSVTLDILEGLSHGFLNFSMICNEASQGSKVCIERINHLLYGATTAPEVVL